MKLLRTETGYRADFAQGLLTLGTLWIVFSLIFICWDWVNYEDRSVRLSWALAASVLS
jgi:hypothetical protein